jgi:hypothetical protein
MIVLAGVLIALALIALTGILIGVLVLRSIFKRIRRNRTLNSAVLRSRAAFTWGLQQQVLRLRMRLDDSLHSGQSAIEVSLRGNAPRGELARLFQRIQAEGATLRTQLRLMESETDTAVLNAELPVVRSRVDEVEALVHRLRSSVSSGLGELSDDTLASLRADVDREVAALHAGVQEMHTLNGYGGVREPGRRPATNRLLRGNES